MTTLHRLRSTATSWKSAVLGSSGVFLRDIGHGLLEVGHNSLALLGLTVIGIALLAGGRADLRQSKRSIWASRTRSPGRPQPTRRS